MTFDINSFKLHLQDVSQHVEQDYTEPIRLDNTRAQLSIQEAYEQGYRAALMETPLPYGSVQTQSNQLNRRWNSSQSGIGNARPRGPASC